MVVIMAAVLQASLLAFHTLVARARRKFAPNKGFCAMSVSIKGSNSEGSIRFLIL